MGRLDEMFERVERIGIYVVLIVLIIGPIFASLFPSIGMHFDQSEGIILLSVVILFLFRYLDRNFRNLSTRGLVRANSLLEAITSIFTNKSSCEHVDIFAHTSNVYYQGIQQKSVTVNHIRLLLRKMDDVNDMVLPEDKLDREKIRSRQQTQIEEWQALKKTGKIGHLEIAFYPFEPMMHMMIVDGKQAVFGLYGLERQFPGVSSAIHDTFTVSRSTEDTRLVIHNLEATFNQIWNEYHTPAA